MQTTGGADLFIGYGGVIVRESVAMEADWFVESHATLLQALKRFKVRITIHQAVLMFLVSAKAVFLFSGLGAGCCVGRGGSNGRVRSLISVGW